MSGSRSIESFRCSCMAALGDVGGVSSLLDAAGPSLRPSERGAHSRQRSAATTLWSAYCSLYAPECAPLLHGRASARHHRARIGWSCPLPSVRLSSSSRRSGAALWTTDGRQGCPYDSRKSRRSVADHLVISGVPSPLWVGKLGAIEVEHEKPKGR